MAKKVKTKTKRAAAEEAAAELSTIHPERKITIAGRDLVVREYGFVEAARLRPRFTQLIEALHERTAGDRGSSYEAILEVLADQIEAVVLLIAASADVEPEWVAQLGNSDGELLQMVWWEVNGSFFVRSVLRRIQVARRLGGDASTSRSPGTESAEETPSGSEGSPSASSSSFTGKPPAQKGAKGSGES